MHLGIEIRAQRGMGKGKTSVLRRTGFLLRTNTTISSCRILKIFICSKTNPWFSAQEVKMFFKKTPFGVGIFWVKTGRWPYHRWKDSGSSLVEDLGLKRLLVSQFSAPGAFGGREEANRNNWKLATWRDWACWPLRAEGESKGTTEPWTSVTTELADSGVSRDGVGLY